MTSGFPGGLGSADRPEPSILGGREPALVVATDGGRPFRLESETAVATAGSDGGAVQVRVRGKVAASSIALVGLRSVHALVAPGSARRECVGPAGSVMEHWLLPPTLPASVVQWHIPAGTSPALRVELPGDPRHVTPAEPEGTSLIVADPAVPDRYRAIVLWGGAGGWKTEASSGSTVATADVVGPQATLVVVSGSAKEIQATVAATGHLAAHEIRAGARTSESLHMETGIDLLDEALHWATHRVARSLIRDEPGAIDGSSFWTLSGAVAAGALDAAGSGLDALETSGSDSDPGWPAHALDVLLAARIAAAGGRSTWSLKHARSLLERESVPILAPNREAEGLWRLALAETADALRYAMPDADLARLRGLRLAVEGSAPGRRTLPMAPPAGAAPRHFLETAAAGESSVPPPTGSPPLDQALRDYTLWYRDPDAAWSRLRTTLAEGLMRGPAGPGSWDSGAEPDGGAPVAGALLTALSRGMLGYDPDAPSGRLSVSPRIPTHLNGWSVRGLRLGDASLGMRYTRDDSTHVFEIEPDFARVPPVVVLQPRLPGGRLMECRVDEEAVTADSTQVGDRIAPRLQVAIDGPRRVTFTTD